MNNTSPLLRLLTSPAKLANALDWKKNLGGSILAMDIGRDQIGVAVASHPSTGDPIEKLSAISVKFEKNDETRRRLAPDIAQEFQMIVREYNVCGFVVSWPMQKEGHCGAACGRVLHTLDSLVTEPLSILTRGRQFCLWDDEHVTPEVDGWGRCPSFGQPTTRTLHVASLEQYRHDCSSAGAADTWDDFCRIHWPKLYQEHYQQGYRRELLENNGETENCDRDCLYDYEDDSVYIKVPAS